MSGHSKWSTIKRKKGREDAKRGNLTSKLVHHITIAARSGADPNSNTKLRVVIEKAQSYNIAKATIERAIKRSLNQDSKKVFHEVTYEGYGPGGVAIMVKCLTDNRNRSVAAVRHLLSKFSGSLGNEGSVGYLFRDIGILSYNNLIENQNFIEEIIESGAEDFTTEGNQIIVITKPNEITRIRDYLSSKGYSAGTEKLDKQATTEIELSHDQSEKMLRLFDALEELEEVEEVYSNALLEE